MEPKKVLIFSIFLVFIIKAKSWEIQLNNPYPAFDHKLYKSVLDPEKCRQQLDYMRKNGLPTLMFADASGKFPKGILEGNLFDLGSYHQCLSIDYEADDMDIEGKYCAVVFDVVDVIKNLYKGNNDVNRENNMPTMRISPLQRIIYAYKIKMVIEGIRLIQKHKNANSSQNWTHDLTRQGVANPSGRPLSLGFSFVTGVGMCVPKSCTTQQVLNSSVTDVSRLIPFTEDYCRLPNDKPWSPADTVASVVFSVIGILTIICTAYDVACKFILKRDSDNSYLLWWSAYTNGRRLTHVTSGSDSLNCLDGIRVLATLWVILGHTFTNFYNYFNSTDMLTWIKSIESWYIWSAPMTVDTFFTMSGLLLVYNSCQKINSSRKFVLNLPLFYISRLLRLFPLLGATVLLQASFVHRVADGPVWHNVAGATETCRTNWWITLLHLQNLVENPTCLNHSWYIAIDVHLYVISSIVMVGVLGRSRQSAWIALSVALLAMLLDCKVKCCPRSILPTILYVVAGAMQAAITFTNLHEAEVLQAVCKAGCNLIALRKYARRYYHNVLTRAPPFFVGMIFGYLLHSYRGKRAHCSWRLVVVCWSSAVVTLVAIVLLCYYTMREDWEHQFIDNVLNSYIRPAWATAVGWIVFACVHGYGGPVNWLLSLGLWRVPARLCYGAYLLHIPLITVVVGSDPTLSYFSPARVTFMFVGYTLISFLISYFMTVLIDTPLSNIFKHILEKQKTNDPKQMITRM